MNIKFKKRETTEALCVVLRHINGADRLTLFKQSRKLGDLDTGFHIILLDNGLIEYDRDIKAVAGHDLPDNETNIFILVDASKAPNDAQKNSLQRLSIEFGLPIKYI